MVVRVKKSPETLYDNHLSPNYHRSRQPFSNGLPARAKSEAAGRPCTVRSALEYLQATPRLGRNNLLLADAGGDIALFEIGHRHSAVVEAEAGLLINTNHYLSPAMQPFFVETDPEPLRGNTFQRYETVKRTLRDAYSRIDMPLAQQLMAQHGGSLDAICRHPRPDSETSTISASIFLPAQRQLLFCHGHPCCGVYHSFSYAVK